jgi:hypothetical protein
MVSSGLSALGLIVLDRGRHPLFACCAALAAARRN